jgi:hypothetical protein
MPSPSGLGGLWSLCHAHQSNLPQVRDATVQQPLLANSCDLPLHAIRIDLGPSRKVFLLHSRWMGNMLVSDHAPRAAKACSQGCPPGRAQVLRSSPQHQGRRPHGLWITRLADGADGPTVVRSPPRLPASETSQNRRAGTGVGPLICQCRAVEQRARRGPLCGWEEVAR